MSVAGLRGGLGVSDMNTIKKTSSTVYGNICEGFDFTEPNIHIKVIGGRGHNMLAII